MNCVPGFPRESAVVLFLNCCSEKSVKQMEAAALPRHSRSMASMEIWQSTRNFLFVQMLQIEGQILR